MSKNSRFISFAMSLLTCSLIAFINFYIANLTNFNLFSFSVSFILPLGALLIGAAANSGYFFSTFFTNRMVDRYDFILMIAISIIATFLIYGIEYYFYVIKKI